MSVVDRISSSIKKDGLKQKYIASKLGWSERKLSAVLTGRRKLSADEFEKICTVLEKEPNEFIKPIYKKSHKN